MDPERIPADDLGATLEKAEHLLDIERYDLAEREIRRGLAAEPELAILHVQLARALDGLGRPEEAEAAAREAVRLDPEEPAATLLLGVLLICTPAAAAASTSM